MSEGEQVREREKEKEKKERKRERERERVHPPKKKPSFIPQIAF